VIARRISRPRCDSGDHSPIAHPDALAGTARPAGAEDSEHHCGVRRPHCQARDLRCARFSAARCSGLEESVGSNGVVQSRQLVRAAGCGFVLHRHSSADHFQSAGRRGDSQSARRCVSRGKWKRMEGRDCITFAGRLHPSKGLDRILPALHAVLEDYPKLRAAIVGDGELRPWQRPRRVAIRASSLLGGSRRATCGHGFAEPKSSSPDAKPKRSELPILRPSVRVARW